MLEALLESSLKEKVLLFLLANDDSYPREIAVHFGFNLNAVQYQLKKLENAGVLLSRLRGKIRLYSLNPAYSFRPELLALLRKAFAALKTPEKEKYYLRGRPQRPPARYEIIIPKTGRGEKPPEKEETAAAEQKYPRKSEPLDFSTD